LVSAPFLLIDGVLQNIDNVISIKARAIEALQGSAAARSHDFHRVCGLSAEIVLCSSPRPRKAAILNRLRENPG
jgi:hypothetical protein